MPHRGWLRLECALSPVLALFFFNLFIRTFDLNLFHDEYVLDGLQLEHCQVAELVDRVGRAKLEHRGRFLDSFHALILEDCHTAVPHLEGQLLLQALEIFQIHVLVDLEVHLGIDVILALHHEELDVDPDVHRLQLEHQVLILLDEVSDLPVWFEGYRLAALLPILLDLVVRFKIKLDWLVRDRKGVILVRRTPIIILVDEGVCDDGDEATGALVTPIVPRIAIISVDFFEFDKS